MDGNLEIEGDLYFALDHFLGQMGKFQTDESALKKLIHSSLEKKNQKKEVQSHYDIGKQGGVYPEKTVSERGDVPS